MNDRILAYAREITARTEQYWCPIKHARTVSGTHERYPGFLEYGDATELHAAGLCPAMLGI